MNHVSEKNYNETVQSTTGFAPSVLHVIQDGTVLSKVSDNTRENKDGYTHPEDALWNIL